MHYYPLTKAPKRTVQVSESTMSKPKQVKHKRFNPKYDRLKRKAQ